MDYLDGFSGYGGFHLGLDAAGFKFDTVYFSEIDKHAIANYKYNFPNSIYAGSITTISRSTVPNIDFFTFGWPCQDNSIAGKRKGQSGGTRSGLLTEAVRIINEYRPKHFIAENVPGLLSVNEGIDYVKAIKILCAFNEDCPQYDIEMQFCNAKWFLPQNRERLYFIGHLRRSGSRKVFPIGENIVRFNEGSSEATNIRCLTAGGHSGGMHSSMTLIKSMSGSETMPTIRSTGHGSYDGKHTHPVFDPNGISQPLTSGHYNVPKIVAMRGRNIENGKRNDYLGTPTIQRLEENADGVANTLTSVQKDNLVIIQKEYTKGNSQGNRVYEPTLSISLNSLGGGKGANTGLYEIKERIRRLTEIECERLQGLPDSWTKYGNYDGIVKEISATQRYKLCGNGVSKPVVEYIGRELYNKNYIG